MPELLKIIHFLAFSAAIGAGLANILAAYRLLPLPPGAMPRAAAYRARLLSISTGGLALLWITGLALLPGRPGSLSDPVFLMKLLVVLVLTAVVTLANLAMIRARRSGTPPDPRRMKRLGLAGPALASLALILAVVAFN